MAAWRGETGNATGRTPARSAFLGALRKPFSTEETCGPRKSHNRGGTPEKGGLSHGSIQQSGDRGMQSTFNPVEREI